MNLKSVLHQRSNTSDQLSCIVQVAIQHSTEHIVGIPVRASWMGRAGRGAIDAGGRAPVRR